MKNRKPMPQATISGFVELSPGDQFFVWVFRRRLATGTMSDDLLAKCFVLACGVHIADAARSSFEDFFQTLNRNLRGNLALNCPCHTSVTQDEMRVAHMLLKLQQNHLFEAKIHARKIVKPESVEALVGFGAMFVTLMARAKLPLCLKPLSQLPEGQRPIEPSQHRNEQNTNIHGNGDFAAVEILAPAQPPSN